MGDDGDPGPWAAQVFSPYANEIDSPRIPTGAIFLAVVWLIPPLLYWLFDHLTRQRKRTVYVGADPKKAQGPIRSSKSRLDEDRQLNELAGELIVMAASLEHSLPHLSKGRAVAGGLGKVMDLVARHHPTDIIMVHPMVASGDKVDYGEPVAEDKPLRINVDNERENVRVFRHTFSPGGPEAPRVDFLMLSHPLFETRTKESIYPNPMSRRKVLGFFSLWNQAVGALLARHKPHIFHLPDFHTAVAPWYAMPKWPRLKVLLVLHNAEYQGGIATDQIRGDKLKTMADIWNLPIELVQKHLIVDGRLNMLQAAVNFIQENQAGIGVCAVSQYYAHECMSTYSNFWRLPGIDGLDNPMLEEERANITDPLDVTKRNAKKEVQELLGLNTDPDARIFVSLGRLVRQKGVDLLADVGPWILSNFPNAQLVIIGPVGDGFGHYAAKKLQAAAERPEFQGRVFVKCEFMRVPESLKFAADFCLMPSRDEPFGYVDIEFAWRGALLVGAQAGGLGKVPGFYYVAQNRENLSRLRRELQAVIADAMNAPAEEMQQMALEAMRCDFPLDQWQTQLLRLYKKILGDANPAAGDTEMQNLPTLGTQSSMVQARSTAASMQGPRTFAPYAQGSKVASAVMKPVSMINVGIEDEQNYGSMEGSIWDSNEEFVTQELPEEEIAERVQAKIAQDASLNIDEILEQIGSEVDIEREAKPMAKWMLKLTFGVANVHWLVACGYIASPIAEFLTFVTAAEWGVRGGLNFPWWFKQFSWFSRVFGRGGLDAPLANLLLFSSNSLGYMVGTPIWALACMRFEPRYLMSASLLLQVPLLVMILPLNPSIAMAVTLKFVNGLVSSASLLFIVFNFMMAIKGDMAAAAVRMGVLEMTRYCVSWVLTGYIFIASPSSIEGTAETPMPLQVTLLLIPIALLALVMTLVPGVLLLYAPGPYREDRLPCWDLGLIWKKKSFLLLALSDVIGALILFPSTCYVSWWLHSGWTSGHLGVLCGLFAIILAVGSAAWAKCLQLASVHGYTLLIGVAVLLAPPGILRAVVQEEVSTFTNLGRSDLALIICVFSLLLEAIRASASWTAKIRILNSRWRLLSYGTLLITSMQFVAFFSPWLCEYIARLYSSTFVTRNQKELADAVVVTALPLGVLQFVAQVLAVLFIQEDMGVAINVEREEESRLRQIVKRSPLAFALFCGICLAVVAFILQAIFFGMPLSYDAVNKCLVQEIPKCELIKEEESGSNIAEWGEHYGLNRYGQKTTGRYNCLRRMRDIGGDTYVFQTGKCSVYLCHSREPIRLIDAPTYDAHVAKNDPPEVWSRHCPSYGRNYVAVQLFEWRWDEVSRECEQYLGPAGFHMVQVTPPAEHVLGDSWAVRYKPTSYKLESRGGGREEFIQMVANCRKHGVAIMVDAVINHMASPTIQNPLRERNKRCNAKEDSEHESVLRCKGWSGNEYGNREYLNNRPGIDLFRPEHFHHKRGNQYDNCGLPPWTNNRHQCDLYGLPDLDTEKKEVQSMIQAYLGDLFEIGVTMLRIDAALNIYPQSLAQILEPFPWEYIVQEYYPGVLYIETRTMQRAMAIGSVTDFTYGQRVATAIFPARPREGETEWIARPEAFAGLLGMSQQRQENCPYNVCDSPTPEEHALLFLDNHDQQRERWKPEHQPWPTNGNCWWDGKDINNCRPIYKHGREYNLAQNYMLSWPYGEAVRITSSYGWKTFDQGPPGVTKGSLREITGLVKCRMMPQTSPVSQAYEDDEAKGWVCEHRWEGVAGFVRFRRLVGKSHKVHKKFSEVSSGQGHICFSMGDVGFVAFSQGYNEIAKTGSNEAWQLKGRQTAVPDGTYCNLGRAQEPIPVPEEWDGKCPLPDEDDKIEVRGGIIQSGDVKPNGAVLIHARYLATESLLVV